MSIDRRTFLRSLGAGGALTCLGMLAGALGCRPAPTEEPEQIMPEPAAGPDPGTGTDQDAPTNEPAAGDQGSGATDAGETGDADAGADAGEDETAVVKCPNCGAENEVSEWGQPLTCWKCGHTWTPQRPA